MPKLLNKSPAQYLKKVLNVRGNIITNPNTLLIETNGITSLNEILTLVRTKLEYFKEKNLVSNVEDNKDYITFIFNSEHECKKVCVSKNGIEVFKPYSKK